MIRTRCVKAEIAKKVNGYGIIRVEVRKVDHGFNMYGPISVYYDVCLNEGEGDRIEYFRTMNEAEKYCLENRKEY